LHAISTGRLQRGDQLPTVREVAVELSINPNTVNRAYAELERDGTLISKRGRGTFVAEPGTSRTMQTDRLADIARRALAECRVFGFTTLDLQNAIKRFTEA
jgi:GntR family transcriptional regulator